MPSSKTQTPAWQARQSRLAAVLNNAGLDGLILNPGPSLVYLTGLHFHLSERPVVAFFVPHAPPVLVLPELEAAKLLNLPYQLKGFTYGEDPDGWSDVFKQALLAAEAVDGRFGLEPRQMRVLELRLLEEAAPQASLISAAEVVAALRMQKDETEIAAMQRAAQVAEQALEATLPFIVPGRTERQIAAELTAQLLRAGSDSVLPFTPIVSTGPNSANPHAFPSDRPLQNGDLLVIDWGASCQGYFSDITRTYAIGQVEPEFEHIAEIVLQANAAGRAACKPGIPVQIVDQAVRQVIEQAGYGQYFFHRTGHGLGMEDHEEPYIRSGNDQPLVSGNTFTIEPGIYLPERGGVRIEDDLVITPKGSRCLTSLPRQLRKLPQ